MICISPYYLFFSAFPDLHKLNLQFENIGFVLASKDAVINISDNDNVKLFVMKDIGITMESGKT